MFSHDSIRLFPDLAAHKALVVMLAKFGPLRAFAWLQTNFTKTLSKEDTVVGVPLYSMILL